jgi:CheY-like chemotaxis protein
MESADHVMNQSVTNASCVRVLVADDDKSITQMFGWMVEILGHRVEVAHNETEILARANEFHPHVIFLDLSLAGANGHDLCRRMRMMPTFESCLFIAQTGWDRPDQIEQSRRAGFFDHWVKPVSMDRMEKLLKTLGSKLAA